MHHTEDSRCHVIIQGRVVVVESHEVHIIFVEFERPYTHVAVGKLQESLLVGEKLFASGKQKTITKWNAKQLKMLWLHRVMLEHQPIKEFIKLRNVPTNFNLFFEEIANVFVLSLPCFLPSLFAFVLHLRFPFPCFRFLVGTLRAHFRATVSLLSLLGNLNAEHNRGFLVVGKIVDRRLNITARTYSELNKGSRVALRARSAFNFFVSLRFSARASHLLSLWPSKSFKLFFHCSLLFLQVPDLLTHLAYFFEKPKLLLGNVCELLVHLFTQLFI